MTSYVFHSLNEGDEVSLMWHPKEDVIKSIRRGIALVTDPSITYIVKPVMDNIVHNIMNGGLNSIKDLQINDRAVVKRVTQKGRVIELSDGIVFHRSERTLENILLGSRVSRGNHCLPHPLVIYEPYINGRGSGHLLLAKKSGGEIIIRLPPTLTFEEKNIFADLLESIGALSEAEKLRT